MTVVNGGHGTATKQVDVNDPRLDRFDIVKEGARRDDIEIVTYESQFPGPNSKAEKRVVRSIALLFMLSGLFALIFLVAYIWWPWRYELGRNINDYYTPVLGISLGLSLLNLGLAILAWAKKLLPHEVSIQARHDAPSPADAQSTRDEQLITGQTLVYVADELGVQRRPLLKGAIALGLAPLGLVAAAPLIGGLIKDPHKADRGEDPPLFRTGYSVGASGGKPVRLTREDGTPVRPEDVSVGGQITVFPGIPGRRHERVRRLAHAADPPAGRRRRHGPQQQRQRSRQPRSDVGQLRRVLQGLHARRLPGKPVRAADQPSALPVPPVAVP